MFNSFLNQETSYSHSWLFYFLVHNNQVLYAFKPASENKWHWCPSADCLTSYSISSTACSKATPTGNTLQAKVTLHYQDCFSKKKKITQMVHISRIKALSLLFRRRLMTVSHLCYDRHVFVEKRLYRQWSIWPNDICIRKLAPYKLNLAYTKWIWNW